MANFTPDGQMQSIWHIRIGSSFYKKYNWSTREVEGGPLTPVDLTGWTAKSHIRVKGAAAHTIELSTENGGITLFANGDIEVRIGYEPLTGTPLLEGLKKLEFDIEFTNPGGTFRRNLIGGPVVTYGQRTEP